MSESFWIWTHLAFFLLFGRIWAAQAKRFDLPPGGVASGLLIIAGLGMMEVQHVDLAGWLLAHAGTLSVSTLLILLLGLIPAMGVHTPVSGLERGLAHLLWLGLGIMLYPSALGFGHYDFYILGYGAGMAWIALAVSLFAWALKQRILAIWLVLSILAWRLQLAESTNLWDYLIDPWVVIGSAFWLLGRMLPRRKSRTQEAQA